VRLRRERPPVRPRGGQKCADPQYPVAASPLAVALSPYRSVVLPEARRFVAGTQLSLPHAGFGRVSAPAQTVSRKPGKAG